MCLARLCNTSTESPTFFAQFIPLIVHEVVNKYMVAAHIDI